MLYPFVRKNLDILFVGLNPANTSSNKGHYFSTNCAFWNQLYESGLITFPIDKNSADEKVFGSTGINTNQWEYGMTDLVNFLAESKSSSVKPTDEDCKKLMKTIKEYKPRIVVLLHSKVITYFAKRYMCKKTIKRGEYGNLGRLINNCDSIFFSVPFPHGNSIPNGKKVELYKQIKNTLETLQPSINN